MLSLTEFDLDEFKQFVFNEGKEEGFNEGIELGRKEAQDLIAEKDARIQELEALLGK